MTGPSVVLAALIIAAAIILGLELVRTALVQVARAASRFASAVETHNALTSTHNSATRELWDRNQASNEDLRARLARDVEQARGRQKIATPPAPTKPTDLDRAHITAPGPVDFLREREAHRGDDDQAPA